MPSDSRESANDFRWIRRSFDRAAAGFDHVAVLQTEVRKLLLDRLDLTALQPTLIIDAGAGTGHASRALKRRYRRARVMAVDSALGMLRMAKRQSSWLRRFDRVCADAVRLPVADGSVGLVLSNLMLHWCDPEALFKEFRRVLAPQGFLSFSSFGPETLRELRSAWGQVDQHTHVNTFIDMHDLGDALVRAGLVGPVLDVERYTLNYTNVHALTADLRAMGAQHVMGGAKGLTSPARLKAMTAAYEAFRHNGRLPASFEVVFGQAWAPSGSSQSLAKEDTTVSLQEIKRQLHRLRTA